MDGLDDDESMDFEEQPRRSSQQRNDDESSRSSSDAGPAPTTRGGDDDDEDDEDGDRVMRSIDDSDDSDSPRPQPPPPIKYQMDLPPARPNLGSKRYYVRLPNFLSIGTHEYHPDHYDDEIDDDELRDAEGRAKLKLRVENTIRWRRTPKDDGTEQVESNAKIVEWSDGTMSLYLGSEIFDINEKSFGEHSHLFASMGSGLQAQDIFHSKLSIRPNSTESFTHRKLTLSLADRSQKTQKIRMLNNPGQDPEARLDELSKQEDDKNKATMRRETKQRRIKERSQVGGPNSSYLEPDYDDEDEEGAISLSAIKRGAMARTYDSDESSEGEEENSDDSDPEFGKVQRKSDRKQKQVVEDSDDE